MDTTGALVDTLGLFPGRELFIGEESGRSVMTFTPFGRVSAAALRAGRIVVGSQERFELEEYRPDGTLARIVRLADRDLTVSRDEVEALIEARVEAAPPERREDFRRTLEALPLPEARPAHGEMLSDSRDHLWVAEWTPAGPLPRAWNVLDPEGRWLGKVTLPERFYPYQIGPDWILGSETDELDVEYLALYRLRKPAP